MFKQLKNGLSKLMTPKKLIIVIVFLLLAYLIYSYSTSKSVNLSGFNGSDVASSAAPAGSASGSNLPNMPSTAAPVFKNPSNVSEIGAGAESMAAGSASFAGSSTNPSDLLPRDNNSAWSNLNPALQTGTGVQTPDLLQAGSLIGLDTIGQSLRNANLQLRSDPYIPRNAVGPWNNSTIEPDLIRAPFDINPSS
jgi:hypothetical protein